MPKLLGVEGGLQPAEDRVVDGLIVAELDDGLSAVRDEVEAELDVGSFFYTTARTIYRHRNTTILGPGHRIRMESRAQTIARRAIRHLTASGEWWARGP